MGDKIAGMTLAEWREFARRDDCLNFMVPSDLRQLVAALPAASAEDVRAGALREAAAVIAKNGAEATAAAMILHIAKTLRAKGKAVLTTGDDFGAQVLQFADALALIPGAKP